MANIVRRKKTWSTAEILDLCDKRRELRKKRFEPEGSEKYKEVNNNIKRCMKKAKENWIGESLVSWCFEPSQPQRITSGLSENSVVRLKKI